MPGKRLEPVAGHGHAQWQRLAGTALAQVQKFLDVQVARRSTEQAAQLTGHRRADVSLDNNVRSRTDCGQCTDHCLAGRAADYLCGALLTIFEFCFLQLIGRQPEHAPGLDVRRVRQCLSSSKRLIATTSTPMSAGRVRRTVASDPSGLPLHSVDFTTSRNCDYLVIRKLAAQIAKLVQQAFQ